MRLNTNHVDAWPCLASEGTAGGLLIVVSQKEEDTEEPQM
jgi:hypothetical protein